MALLKDLFKEIFAYAPLYVYLTIFGPVLNEAINTFSFLQRRFMPKKWEQKSPIPIFLIPGTLGGRGTMDILKARLLLYFRDVFTLKPVRLSLVDRERNIIKLNDLIDVKRRLVKAEKVIIIGHSQGGIIARRWMDIFDPKGEKTLVIITLGTPHSGSWAAALALPLFWWSRALWQLLPPVAQNLDKSASAARTISIRGKNDPSSLSWPYKAERLAQTIEIDGMHISMIFGKEAFQKICKAALKKANEPH